MERPSHPSLWRFTTPQRGEPCFSFTVQLAVPVLPPRSISKRCFDTVQSCALPQPLDRGAADLHGFSDLGVGPLLLLRTTICLQENAGTGDGAGGGCTLLDRALKEKALGIGEGDDVEFCDREALREMVR